MSRFYGSPLALASSSVIDISTAPAGFWNDVPDPKFVYYNGYTYIGYVDGVSGNVEVITYRHSNGAVSTPVVVATAVGGANGNPDSHDSPALLVRSSDHKLIVAYSPHSQIPLYVRISTNSLTTDPTMIGGFGSENDVGTAAQAAQPGTKTYPSLIELTSEGAIYLWWRRYNTAGQTRQGYVRSTDNGATWGTYVNVWGGNNGTGTSNFNYRRIATNGTDRMDLYVTENARTLGDPSHLYHLYYDGGNWKQTDGTSTGLTGGLFPVNATVVKDTADGPACPLSCGYDGTGKPVTMLMTYDATEATFWQARWDGAAWVVVEIGSSVGLPGSSNPFVLDAGLDRDDVDTCWFPVRVGGKFELFRWDSVDSGATWTSTQLTSGSAFDNLGPDSVWDHAADLKVVWGYGSYTSDLSNNMGIRGGF